MEKLGFINTIRFKDHIVISISQEWLSLNNGHDLTFEAKLTKDGHLVLTSKLKTLEDKDIGNLFR